MRRKSRRRYEREEFGGDFDARSEASPRSSSPRRRRKPSKKRLRKRKKSPLAPPALKLLLLAGVLYGLYLLVSTASGGGEGDAPVSVVVENGDTLSSVAEKLEEAGVIGSPAFFELEARIEGGATEIQAGEYRFQPGESGDEIREKLYNGEVSTFEIAIPEGLTLSQTAQRISEQSGIPAEELEAAAERTDYGYVFLEDPAVETTEGFLFPKKYDFYKGIGASGIVARLLEQYRLESEALDFAEAQDRMDLTEYELVTIASLIEKESANAEERTLVASVIHNRIQAGMPLQVDATIQYVLDKPKERLSLADLEIDSPYNTYAGPGLPPGPIASPSRESIEAALEPTQTDYLYYVLEAGGEAHFFTDDYDEFLEAKEEAEDER